MCILTSIHQPFDVRIFHKEARSLAEAGYRVSIVAPKEGNETRGKVSIRAVPYPRNRLERLLMTSWRVLWSGLTERADIYHFHDPELVGMGILLKMFGKKVIYDVHEDVPKTILGKEYLPTWTRELVALFADGFEKAAARMFDAIIPATDDIAAKFSSCQRVVTVKNFPTLLTSNPSGRTRCSDRFRSIYVGVLSEARGIGKIVEALGHLQDLTGAELILCGDFSPAPYEAEVRQLPGFEKTDCLGYVEHWKAQALLNEVDIGLVCIQPVDQYLTALPTKLFEYMAAGLPVVASNFPLWREIVEGNFCGLCVDPTDPRGIANAIRYLHDRPDLRREMGLNGRQAVVEKYNWQAESQSLIAVYESVLSEN